MKEGEREEDESEAEGGRGRERSNEIETGRQRRREGENKVVGMHYGEAPMCAGVMGVKGGLWVVTERESGSGGPSNQSDAWYS